MACPPDIGLAGWFFGVNGRGGHDFDENDEENEGH
jgi:hypothetical protein